MAGFDAANAAFAGAVGGNSGGGGGDVTKAYVDLQDSKKVDKVEGKGLSTNDYTDAEKTKLGGIAAGAEVNVQSDWEQTDDQAPDYIKNKPSDMSFVSTATGAALAITDAAGGYVQSVTVKGNSEVIDGAIKSIGDAGWGKVDLGTLTWEYFSQTQTFIASCDIPFATRKGGFCTKYDYVISGNYLVDKTFSLIISGTSQVLVRDLDYTDATAFKSAMSGVIVYYPLSDTTGTTPIVGIISKDGAGQGTAATITTGLPLRSVGSVYDTMTNGLIVKRCAEIDLGDLTWTRGETTTAGVYNFYTYGLSPLCLSNNNTVNGICADYAVTTIANIYNGNASDGSIAVSGNTIRIRDDSYTDAAAFKTALSGVKLIYILATRTTLSLTSTETAALAALRTYSGTTNISTTDSPVIVIDYFKNTDNGKAVANVDNKCLLKCVTWRGTGTRTNSNIHFPKKPTLVLSIQFTNKPSNSISTAPFAYGAPSVYVAWSSGAGTFSGNYNSRLSYSEDGLTMTIDGSDKGSALNDETTDYILYYL